MSGLCDTFKGPDFKSARPQEGLRRNKTRGMTCIFKLEALFGRAADTRDCSAPVPLLLPGFTAWASPTMPQGHCCLAVEFSLVSYRQPAMLCRS